jgi:hypothetical protein
MFANPLQTDVADDVYLDQARQMAAILARD